MDLRSVLGTLAGGALAESDNGLLRILGSLAGAGGQNQGGILGIVLSVIQEQGGMDGLISLFQRNGLSSKTESWVGQGPNEELEPDQVQQVLGSPVIEGIASRLGVEPEKASSIIAAVLPELVNQITPAGRVTGEQDDVISRGLSLLSRL